MPLGRGVSRASGDAAAGVPQSMMAQYTEAQLPHLQKGLLLGLGRTLSKPAEELGLGPMACVCMLLCHFSVV